MLFLYTLTFLIASRKPILVVSLGSSTTTVSAIASESELTDKESTSIDKESTVTANESALLVNESAACFLTGIAGFLSAADDGPCFAGDAGFADGDACGPPFGAVFGL